MKSEKEIKKMIEELERQKQYLENRKELFEFRTYIGAINNIENHIRMLKWVIMC